MILTLGAFTLLVIGIFKSLDLVNNINRIIIYGAQSAICIATLIFGLYYFNKKEKNILEVLLLLMHYLKH